MKLFATAKKIVPAFLLAAIFCAHAQNATNFPAPQTARDFYNAGTKLLAATNFNSAEQMFESALATQDERVQPLAEFNLAHTRFADGADILKRGPDAQKVSAQGDTALAAGENAIRSAQSALAENQLDKMIEAYIEGRGARKNLRDAEKSVQAAIEAYGKTLQKWQRADDDFHNAAELNPTDTNATRNTEIVEKRIAKLVDELRKMAAMMGALGKQRQDLGKLLSQLKGQIPAPNAPPGGAGDGDEDDGGSGNGGVLPESLSGREENSGREGDQIQVPLSPDVATQILNGLGVDGSRRLSMSDKDASKPKDKNGRNW
jgi:hypothetical protein